VPLWVHLVFDVTTTGYTESSDNLIIEYGDGTDIVEIDATGFIDQTSDQVRDIAIGPLASTSTPTVTPYTVPVSYLTSTGTVTQITSKATGVTLNAYNGVITMNNAALAAGAEVSFTVTNSAVGATDVIVASIASAATAGAYTCTVDAVASGSFRLSIGNVSAGSLSEAIVINFIVLSLGTGTAVAQSGLTVATTTIPSLRTPVANSTIRIANNGDGEYGSGNAANTLSVRTEYIIVPTVAFGTS
jgi:hypothetical protein